MRLMERPWLSTTFSASMISGLRASAPGRLITATLRNRTMVSSTKTASAQSSAPATTVTTTTGTTPVGTHATVPAATSTTN